MNLKKKPKYWYVSFKFIRYVAMMAVIFWPEIFLKLTKKAPDLSNLAAIWHSKSSNLTPSYKALVMESSECVRQR